MASQNRSDASGQELPFGAGAIESDADVAVENGGKRGGRRRRRSRGERGGGERPSDEKGEGAERAERPAPAATDGAARSEQGAPQREGEGGGRPNKWRRWQDRRRRRRRGGQGGQGGGGQQQGQGQGQGRVAEEERGERQHAQEQGGQRGGTQMVEGLLVLDKASFAHLRRREKEWLPSKEDVHVSPRLVQKFNLREGSIVAGPMRRGHGRYKWDLENVTTIDGKDPREMRDLPRFKTLTSIDPDFHYAMGDVSGETSLRVVDLICPIGRGQRGLIVAPPRTGKTILLQQMAKAVEKAYPDVHLMVLLVDERPEEATEWKRTTTTGEVFVSTNDEMPKRHVELAEVVWRRCQRLVEMGEDVILLLDSITRLGRAYNNVHGNSGKTMSGGIDTRALERPKQFFGSARNTETAGSLTIIATALIETGSRMDQIIFEEFKGTGNMELVLSRKLADRRIFPAIDIQKSGTRKEEKLISSSRLKLVQTLRRVLLRMHFAEAMELLVTKLDDVEKTDDFLQRFEVDPEA